MRETDAVEENVFYFSSLIYLHAVSNVKQMFYDLINWYNDVFLLLFRALNELFF